MKQKILFLLLLLLSLGGCTTQQGTEGVVKREISDEHEAVDKEGETVGKIQLLINGKTFVVTMEHTEAAQALTAMLPMTIEMEELNGNEKYHYLS